MIQYSTNPTLNQIFPPLNVNATKRWKWNGYAWDIYVVPPIINHDELNNRNLSNQQDTSTIQVNYMIMVLINIGLNLNYKKF